MSKRIGYLYEKFLDESNFIEAERTIGKNKKRKNKMAKYIYENAEKFGKNLFGEYSSGSFAFSAHKCVTITDSYKGKKRDLKIPCLKDQAVMQAWLNIAIPYIERRNYYYNCGSIPHAGQTRAVNAIKKWLKNKKIKYVAVLDIKKFYDTCPHWLVMDGLRKIFKDERFLKVAEDILHNMNISGVGLAIGYPVSHWFANVALCELDNESKRLFPSVKTARYMDDSVFLAANKRLLRRLVIYVKCYIFNAKMQLKKWQARAIGSKGFAFLSYRFFNGYTLLIKRLANRIRRRFEKAKGLMDVHIARGLLSDLGILKHCDSFNFRKKFVFKIVNINHLKRMVSDYDKSQIRRETCCC